MPTFFTSPRIQGAVHPWSPYSIMEQVTSMGESPYDSVSSNAWPSGTVAIFVPFGIPLPMYVQTFYWFNGAAIAGNVDMGVYTIDGKKVRSLGAGVIQSGTNVVQSNILSPALHLGAGQYYMGIVFQNVTGTNLSSKGLAPTGTMVQVYGMAKMDGAYPLPDVPTLGNMGFVDYIPGFGIASTVGIIT